MILPENKKEEISKYIKQVESKSGAELVAVIAQKSGDYALPLLMIALVSMFVISGVIIFYGPTNALTLLNFQIIFLALLYLLYIFRKEKLVRFLPDFYKKNRASNFAHEHFESLGINKTKTRQGVMFFVSVQERYVEIIADEAISKEIEDGYWKEIVDGFISHVKKDEFALGYKEAIDKCSKVLIEKFPISDDDENELGDEVIEL